VKRHRAFELSSWARAEGRQPKKMPRVSPWALSLLGSNQDSPDPESSCLAGIFDNLLGIGHFPSIGARFPAIVCPLMPEKLRQNYGATLNTVATQQVRAGSITLRTLELMSNRQESSHIPAVVGVVLVPVSILIILWVGLNVLSQQFRRSEREPRRLQHGLEGCPAPDRPAPACHPRGPASPGIYRDLARAGRGGAEPPHLGGPHGSVLILPRPGIDGPSLPGELSD
jgi:hypothetical protein